jgi:hypothetical protein
MAASAAYDYDITIPGERIGDFRELLRAGIDALGPDEEDSIDLGKSLLRQLT